MPDASDILRYSVFWWFYVRASDDALDSEMLRHFSTTTINGHQYAEAVIPLPCGTGFSLEITITPELGSVNLGLRNARTNAVAEMGWWDDARWHPHGLRWSELEKLYQYWLNDSLPNIHPSAAFLLLAVFVGNGADERDQFSERKGAIAGHYEQLRLFTPVEITELVDHTFVLPTEEDYNWSQDRELGWVFGGQYPCYSIRNREHRSGAEGRFPFSDWSRVMAQLPSSSWRRAR
jgi:hypothetical protein